MTGIAKRGMAESWRDAVAARAGGRRRQVVATFDALVSAGASDAEAAFRALQAENLLWSQEEPRRRGSADQAALGAEVSDL